MRALRSPRRANDDHGDTTRLSTLFEDHVDDVFGFVLARTGSRQLAEEVTSDAFAEAARVFSLGRGDEVSRPWLIHTARVRLIDHWRRAGRHEARLAKAASAAGVRFQEASETTEAEARLLHALASLPDRQRAAIILRYLDGYSVAEVAQLLDATYRATESVLARARTSLLTSMRSEER